MLRKPKDVSELLYFSQREFEEGGFFKAWVFKPVCECGGLIGVNGKNATCPKCGSQTLTKKTSRSKQFTCSNCGKVKALVCKNCNKGYERESFNLEINIDYTCPHCGERVETVQPWKKKGTKFQFSCPKCGERLTIKQLKKRG